MFWVLFWLRLLDGHPRLVVFGDLSLYTEGFISGFSFMGLKKKFFLFDFAPPMLGSFEVGMY